MLVRRPKRVAVLLVATILTACGGPSSLRATRIDDSLPIRQHYAIEDRYEVQRGWSEHHATFVWYSTVLWNTNLAIGNWYLTAHDADVTRWYTTHKPKPVVHHAQLVYFPRPPASPSGYAQGGTPCAIPSYICARESGGNIRAQNPVSSASGKYQILDSTWNGYGGYVHAKDAPESVQDAKAASMAVCNWMPPNYCA